MSASAEPVDLCPTCGAYWECDCKNDPTLTKTDIDALFPYLPTLDVGQLFADVRARPGMSDVFELGPRFDRAVDDYASH